MLGEKDHFVYFAYISSHEMYRQPMLEFWGNRLFYLPPRETSKTVPARLLRKLKSVFRIEPLVRQYWYRGKHTIDERYPSRIDTFLRQNCVPLQFDAVMVEYVNMSRSLLNFPSDTLKIIDTHDVFSDRDKLFSGANRTFSTTVAQEAKGLNRADVILAIQPEEKAFFEKITSKKVLVVGHTVDISSTLSIRKAPRNKLLFLASRHEANVVSIKYFIDSVLPLLKRTVPEVELLIAGKVGERMTDSPDYRKLGEVANLQTLYEQVDVVINPVLMGTGLKIKNIEAMGYGKPLVTTSVGAKGLEAGTNSAFLVGDTTESFAAYVVKLLTDDPLYQSVCTHARVFAEQYNEQVFSSLNEILHG